LFVWQQRPPPRQRHPGTGYSSPRNLPGRKSQIFGRISQPETGDRDHLRRIATHRVSKTVLDIFWLRLPLILGGIIIALSVREFFLCGRRRSDGRTLRARRPNRDDE